MLTTEYTDQHAVTDYTQAGAGVAGILNGAKLIFGLNVIAPSKTTAVGDITQSVDADLAPATLTWGSAGRDADGDIVTLSASVPVKIASGANACVINCLGITDSAGVNLLACEDISQNPMNLPDTLALFNVQIPFAPGNPQGKTAKIVS